MKRDFIDLWQISPEEGWNLLELTFYIKNGDKDVGNVLKGKHVALLFSKPSTRTRVSFEIAIQYSTVPVINALTDKSHPCQILSDIFTLYEKFGKGIKELKIAYVGDGNNVCNTWLVGAGLFGLNLYVANPEGYEPSSYYLQAGRDLAEVTGGNIYLTTNEPIAYAESPSLLPLSRQVKNRILSYTVFYYLIVQVRSGRSAR